MRNVVFAVTIASLIGLAGCESSPGHTSVGGTAAIGAAAGGIAGLLGGAIARDQEVRQQRGQEQYVPATVYQQQNPPYGYGYGGGYR